MKALKSFFLEEFRDKEAYTEFLKFMLVHSDFFSLVYFRYHENEKMKFKTKIIQNAWKLFYRWMAYTIGIILMLRWIYVFTKMDIVG